VRPTTICYVGKESNRLDDVKEGLVSDIANVREMYTDPKNDWWSTLVVPILRLIPRKDLASECGMSERSVQAARNGRSRPRVPKRALLTRADGHLLDRPPEKQFYSRPAPPPNYGNNLHAHRVLLGEDDGARSLVADVAPFSRDAPLIRKGKLA
jgi:hypothetical protein